MSEADAAGTLKRYTAFSDVPEGGNPAGVWVGDTLPTPQTMLEIAADVGASETAFLAPASGRTRTVRYFSPKAEVAFCGHATIASGVALADSEGEGEFILHTLSGAVKVEVRGGAGEREAALTSVTPQYKIPDHALLLEAVAALRWQKSELDHSIPPAVAYAGAWHLVLAVKSLDRLARLDYDVDALKALMQREGLTTLQLVWRERPNLFHARNPFPVGGVLEDPATGAAAAALGGYLRDAELIDTPYEFEIRQGEFIGRPGRITVQVPVQGGIVVRGRAVALDSE